MSVMLVGTIFFAKPAQAAPPTWTSNVPVTIVEIGNVGQVTISASGGSGTKIECTNCGLATIVDHGNGTATVSWNTATNPPFPHIPGKEFVINLKASNIANPLEFINGGVVFKIIDPVSSGGLSWISIPAAIKVNLGETGQSIITAKGAADITLSCTNCDKATFIPTGGVGVVTWDTAKNPPASPGLKTMIIKAFNKSSPGESIEANVIFNIVGSGSAVPEIEKPKLDIGSFLEDRYPVPAGYTGPLPDCAFHGTCDDVNDLLTLAINIGKWIFGLLGTFALAMFVYGGFTWILSGGNPERVKQGKSIVVAAVTGLIIAFGAYVLINFLLDALTVKDAFRGIS